MEPKYRKCGILLLMALGLAGCAVSKSEPPKTAVQKAYMQAQDPYLRDNWPAHPNVLMRRMMRIVKIVGCQPAKAPGIRTCTAFMNYPSGPVHRRVFQVMREGGGKWHLYNNRRNA